ncbi:LamG-like jellyroll fold domain-containing protein [Algoriphagus halophytocola]|uniref:LamG domain-containing protein n=1 Tax=Algoriphagus halophytocola TaxID=2991499 RepID=A0ABY6MPL3_9BACT|nr:LamG-like jellyroll fold domain-containing protein [Algoriphagus sp. TR-M5]UZD24234.1 hypothetical protein OM944_06970 [Algoriphagus sp. TR-M5]
MSTKIIDYLLNDLDVKNPDGSKRASVRNCSVVTGPGNVSGWGNFPQAIQFNGTSVIRASVQKAEYNFKQFAVRTIFRVTSRVSSRVNLFETNSLPIAIFLLPGSNSNSFYLNVSVNSPHYGWTGPNTKYDKEILLNTWSRLEVAYDLDTLAVFVDGRLLMSYALPEGTLKAGTGSSLFIGAWVDGARHPFTGEMAILEVHDGIPNYLEDTLDANRESAQWHISYKFEEFRKDRYLGTPTGKLSRETNGGSIQTYTGGAILYNRYFGAFAMYGAIYAYYQSLSTAMKRELGELISDEQAGNSPSVRKSVFRKGAIYWSSATGAKAVTGQIYVDYCELGEDSSVMRLPTGVAGRVSSGKQQVFQGGRMYYKNGAARAFEVHGSILARYLALGGPAKFGFPLTDEKDVKSGTRTVGKLSEFESCSIYWSGATGAFEVHGAIRAKYHSIGGAIGSLGFPTSNESDVPGSSGSKMNSFQNGAIVWFGSAGTYVCYPFEIHITRIRVRDADSDIFFKDDSDIYAKIIAKENGHQVFSSVIPQNGTYSNTTEKTVNYTLRRTFVPNNIHKKVLFDFQAWDSDNGRPFGGGDDNLGHFSLELNAANAWGMKTNNGIFNSSTGTHSLRLDWSVRPKIKQGTMSDRDYYFWGVPNQGTNIISWNTYAAAFRDVTTGANFFDHVSLKSTFYELAVKELAAGGNCFGMSLEGIYARKCLSRFGKPLNRFNWNQTEREFNIKHQYQVGAAAIWWFVGQFISGNTHDPVGVFEESLHHYNCGNNPVLCISQNYDFSGAPHCILPHQWKKNGDNWEIVCFDPNITSGTRSIFINRRTNTYSYNNGRAYSGGAWSGGRLQYMPWNVLNREPRTPVWDIILLILAGTVLIFADSGETESITDSKGKNLDGGKLAQSQASLRRNMFVPVHGLDSRSNGHAYYQKGQAFSNDFIHKIKGTKNAKFDYAVKNLTGEFKIHSPILRGESETYDVKGLGEASNSVTILSKNHKTYDLEFSQKIGKETIQYRMEKVPADTNKDLKIQFKPGNEGIDLISSGGATDARFTTKVFDENQKLKQDKQFILPLDGGLRLRPTTVLSTGDLLTSKIEVIGGSILGSSIIKPK